MSQDLERIIDNAWEDRDAIGLATGGEIRLSVDRALALLDAGEARVAEPDGAGGWRVNQWLKKAVLLSFRLNDNALIDNGPGAGHWWDKVPSKFTGWGETEFRSGGFRAVPGSIVRRGSFIGRNAVLMPSFVNIGAYVDEG
ncbi:MAG TPA: 2,3,4,5-tetrahydropyridine-2,6-dicarboxylate N-succinyltransferase, partial [Sphingomonas sp.]|nr:2,3,4,5-tetrahydropyridine-2,6-dicarboxylate N-succinyltransferase [Sphingomonas sp.]